MAERPMPWLIGQRLDLLTQGRLITDGMLPA
jgi:hypothetical protein